MSNIQKVLLAASCIFFAATIYSLFYFQIYLIILFFLIHSLCLLFFTYMTFSDASKDVRFLETYHQDVGVEMADKDNEIVRLKEQITAAEAEVSDYKIECDNLRGDNDRMKREIEELNREKTAYEEKAKAEEASNETAVKGLLPPLTGNEDGRETVNIIAIANQAKEELMESAHAAGLYVSVSAQGDTLLVRADPNRLIVLFRNIIDNSIKYMRRQGSLVITISTIGDDNLMRTRQSISLSLISRDPTV